MKSSGKDLNKAYQPPSSTQFLFPSVIPASAEYRPDPSQVPDWLSASSASSFKPKLSLIEQKGIHIKDENLKLDTRAQIGDPSHDRTEGRNEKVNVEKRKKPKDYYYDSDLPDEVIKMQKKKHRKQDDFSSDDNCSGDDRKRKEKRRKKKKKHKYKHKEKDKVVEKVLYDIKKPDTIWIEKTGLTFENAFREDKRPDRENLNYDTLYRLDIATYQRRQGITCVGLNKKQTIIWSDGRTKQKRQNAQNDSRYFERIKLVIIDEPEEPASTLMPNYTAKEISAGNYMALNKQNEIQKLGLDDRIELSGTLRERDTSDEKKANNHNRGKKPVENKKSKIEEFNSVLRENPHNVETWLEFARFESLDFDENDSHILSLRDEKSIKKSKALTERKINILEKALQCNPTSVKLLTEYMNCCRAIMDTEELTQKWDTLIFKFPSSTDLWQEYLIFCQSQFSTFSVREAIDTYGKCFRTILSILEGSIKTHSPPAYGIETLLVLLFQYCLFLKQSGHTEKALASLQALVEFNCFCPGAVKEVTLSGQKAFFETFWDSETPKFGESVSTGWAKWMDLKNGKHATPLKASEVEPLYKLIKTRTDSVIQNSENESLDSSKPKHKLWMMLEQKREDDHWKPWKSNSSEETDDDCDDPDRMVLFSDVNNFLFKVDSMQRRFDLVMLFLSLLGLQFRKNLFHCEIYTKFLALGITDWDQVSDQSESNNGLQTRHLEPFTSSYWIPLSNCKNDYIDFIRFIFAKSLELFSGLFLNKLSVLWLEFEILISVRAGDVSKVSLERVKWLRKLAKNLLKISENRSYLDLWELFGIFEWKYGSQEEACRIFDKALTSCSEGAGNQKKGLNPFSHTYRIYAEILLNLDLSGKDEVNSPTKNKAINVLCLLADPSLSGGLIDANKYNPIRTLKARKEFEEKYNRLVNSGSSEDNASQEMSLSLKDNELDWVLCYCLFEYATTDINSAIKVLDQVLNLLTAACIDSSRFPLLRCLIWYKQLLLRNCFKTASTGVQVLRETIWKGIEMFPDDVFFNQMLIDFEGNGVSMLKMRRHYERMLLNAVDPLPWIFAIKYEESRLHKVRSLNDFNEPHEFEFELDQIATTLPMTGIIHRMRSIYERATDHPSTQYSIGLWRKYMKFEMKYGDAKRAKNIYIQALQNCPWAKAIYMDAIEYFPEDFQDIVDVMQEKEIRVRLPIEELEIFLDG